MRITATSEARVLDAAKEIETILRAERGLTPGEKNTFAIRNESEMMEMEADVARNFGDFLLGVTALRLLVGGIGVMTVMLATVSERTKEIGLRKALGARQRS